MFVAYLSWFNFIFGSFFVNLCFKLIGTFTIPKNKNKVEFQPRIKLNHNILNNCKYQIFANKVLQYYPERERKKLNILTLKIN